MRRERNPIIEDIMRENNIKKKYETKKKRTQTIAQFQLNHCRYCKNINSEFCEIRKNIDNELSCEYEEYRYERRNIK